MRALMERSRLNALGIARRPKVSDRIPKRANTLQRIVVCLRQPSTSECLPCQLCDPGTPKVVPSSTVERTGKGHLDECKAKHDAREKLTMDVAITSLLKEILGDWATAENHPINRGHLCSNPPQPSESVLSLARVLSF